MDDSQKLKNKATLWSSSSTSGCLSEESENTNLKSSMRPYNYWSILYKSWGMETNYMFIDWWWMGKEHVVYMDI